MALASIFPKGGPSNGGTDVRLAGEGIAHTGHAFAGTLLCDFGGVHTTGRMEAEPEVAAASGSRVVCPSPGTAVAGEVGVRFSTTQGSSFASGVMPFRYYDPPVVRELRPSSGPVAGGTIVLVLGAGFGPYPSLGQSISLCRFGTHATAPPQHHGGAAMGAETGAALQPAGFALRDPTLRTHLPRFVTTPATVLHDGALTCRAPAAFGLGAYDVAVSLNGADFSSGGGRFRNGSSRPSARFQYYDNWLRPHVGGNVPSARGAHAAARLSDSLWLFGGWGERRGSAGGWVEVKDEPPSVDGSMRDVDGLHTRHNDLMQLQTSIAGEFYPSDHQPDLVWSNQPYRSYTMHAQPNASAAREAAARANAEPAAAPTAGTDTAAAFSASPSWHPQSTSAIASPPNASHAYVLLPAPAPRPRNGHSLTAVGPRLVLFGGEATAHIEFPLADKFAVKGLRTLEGTLKPRLRDAPGEFVPARPLDPVTATYKLASEGADVWAHHEAGAPMGEGVTGDPRVVKYNTRQWQADPLWEATEPKEYYGFHGEGMLAHTATRTVTAADGSVRVIRDDLDGVDTAEHISSDVYTQRSEALDDVHVYDMTNHLWVRLQPSGERLPSRTEHAACAITLTNAIGERYAALAVFGGWRLAPCGQSVPCSQLLNDFFILHLEAPPLTAAAAAGSHSEGSHGAGSEPGGGAGSEPGGGAGSEPGGGEPGGREDHSEICCARSHWEQPILDGLPPLPRRGHTMTTLPAWGGGPFYDGPEGDDDAALLVLFGLSSVYNLTIDEARGEYLNDVHVLHLANRSWYPLEVRGSAPVPRAGHTTTLSPDGRRLVVYGGMDGGGSLADCHVLDLSVADDPIWWQLIASGDTPRPRHAHSATLFGTDLLVVGGLPPGPRAFGASMDMLNLVDVELQTSAVIGRRVETDLALKSSCTLMFGSSGSAVQQWTCGVRLRERAMNGSLLA